MPVRLRGTTPILGASPRKEKDNTAIDHNSIADSMASNGFAGSADGTSTARAHAHTPHLTH